VLHSLTTYCCTVELNTRDYLWSCSPASLTKHTFKSMQKRLDVLLPVKTYSDRKRKPR
jgi:hypothetical protein